MIQIMKSMRFNNFFKNIFFLFNIVQNIDAHKIKHWSNTKTFV
jgi:hypothetical protein